MAGKHQHSETPTPRGPRRRNPLVRLFLWCSALVRFVLSSVLVLLAVAAFSYWLMLEYIRGEETVTPQIQGKELIEALEMIREDGLSLKLDRREPSEEIPAGYILSQKPPAGSRVKVGSALRVVVSSGVPLITLPDLRGETKIAAGIRLRRQGLDVGNVTSVDAPGSPGGVILATDPPGGSGVPEGTTVQLLVSRETGVGRMLMPNLLGFSLEESEQLLAEMGLTISKRVEAASDEVLAGQVHAQSPLPGETINAESQIVLSYAPQYATPYWDQEPVYNEDGERQPMLPPIEHLDGRPGEPARPVPREKSTNNGPAIDFNWDDESETPPANGEEEDPEFYFRPQR